MDRNNRMNRMLPGVPSFPMQELAPLRNLSMSQSAVTDEVKRVVVKASAPHPGYGLRITAIRFQEDLAYIYLETVRPDPSAMYPQVIANLQATTYLDNRYSPVFPPEYEKYLSPYI